MYLSLALTHSKKFNECVTFAMLFEIRNKLSMHKVCLLHSMLYIDKSSDWYNMHPFGASFFLFPRFVFVKSIKFVVWTCLL